MTIPESHLIRQEHIIRDMLFTSDVKLTRKSLIRWIALSLGLISPNETRTLMLDLLEALFHFHVKGDEPDITAIVEEINKKREEKTNPKAVRYHLLQLKNRGLIERKAGRYAFVLSPFSEGRDLSTSIEYTYKQNVETAFEKIKAALKALERTY
jgi:DNA-binding transcriptional ArsR family regulator